MVKKQKRVVFTWKDKEALILLWKSIQEKRNKLKLSQSDLSEKTGIDRSYISLLESWRANITFLKLKKIEGVLGKVF